MCTTELPKNFKNKLELLIKLCIQNDQGYALFIREAFLNLKNFMQLMQLAQLATKSREL